jgi:hypothetical protein
MPDSETQLSEFDFQFRDAGRREVEMQLASLRMDDGFFRPYGILLLKGVVGVNVVTAQNRSSCRRHIRSAH